MGEAYARERERKINGVRTRWFGCDMFPVLFGTWKPEGLALRPCEEAFQARVEDLPDLKDTLG